MNAALKGCNRYQGCISYVCERNVYFYVLVFSKSMSCKYFHFRSNLGLISFEYFLGKKLFMSKEKKIPETNLKCTCRFTQLLNLDTVRAMSGTNRGFRSKTSSSTKTTLNNAC